MKIISHRGNLFGSDPKTENFPEQIKFAIEKGFDVEIDLWVNDGNLFLGHDNPKYLITYEFLKENSRYLWIHCKNLKAFIWAKSQKNTFNYFWHDTDKVTITSCGIPWCYPETYVDDGVTVVWDSDWEKIVKQNPKILGICTDYPLREKENLT